MRVLQRRPLLAEAIVSAAVASAIAGALLWLGPPGVDLAAHDYQRTFLLHHGFALWNNFWYAGRYSFVTYSFVYYPLAAVAGIKLLALLSMGVASGAFALVVGQEWGRRARFSSRTFAVLWPGLVLSAAFPFALGAATALVALACLLAGRRRPFALAILVTLAASPLALLLLALVLTGSLFDRKPRRATVGVIAAAILAELALRRVFPGQGEFPFSVADFVQGLLFAALGIAVTVRVPGARRLFGLFAVLLGAFVVAFLLPGDLGSNVERLKWMAIPLAVLATTIAPRRILLVIPLVAVAGYWNISALAQTASKAGTDPADKLAYWRPALHYLHHHLGPSYRVEAVDTVEHWPAVYLPEAGIPIVRGWYRQNDFPQNQVLYDGNLGAHAYQAWLRSLGVRYVVITDAPTDYSARAEARLIRTGRSGLVPVFRSAHVDVYELKGARPIVTGGGDARVLKMYPTRLVLDVSKPGRYRVKVRWSPYWQSAQACVWKGVDGSLRLQAKQAGEIDLRMDVSVSRSLETLTGLDPRRVCSSG